MSQTPDFIYAQTVKSAKAPFSTRALTWRELAKLLEDSWSYCFHWFPCLDQELSSQKAEKKRNKLLMYLLKKRNIQKIPQLIPFLSTAHRSSVRNVKTGSVNAFTGLKFVRSMQGESKLWPDNVSFKLRISQNRKWADKNSSKQYLWIKNCVKPLIYGLK